MPRSLTDAFKVIAAIAVVGIHASSPSETRFAQNHDYLSLDFLSVLVNQWARFSVPLFIYLSGYGLARSEKAIEGGFLKFWGSFLYRRLPVILVPYLFFSSIALAMEFHSYHGPVAGLWNSIAQRLITGSADYHLYFLVILAQCYLLFPILQRWARGSLAGFRFAAWMALVMVSGLLYKGSSELLLINIGLRHPGWHASFAIYWLPYFMLGILHAEKTPYPGSDERGAGVMSRPTQLWKSIAPVLAILLALAYVVAEYIFYSYDGTPADYYNHFSRPSVMLYALAVVWWLHSQSDGRGRSKPTPTVGQRLAPLTFSVYLIHPQILRVFDAYLPALPTLISWLLVVVATFLLVSALALLTNKAQEKGPAYITWPVRLLQRCLGLK